MAIKNGLTRKQRSRLNKKNHRKSQRECKPFVGAADPKFRVPDNVRTRKPTKAKCKCPEARRKSNPGKRMLTQTEFGRLVYIMKRTMPAKGYGEPRVVIGRLPLQTAIKRLERYEINQAARDAAKKWVNEFAALARTYPGEREVVEDYKRALRIRNAMRKLT